MKQEEYFIDPSTGYYQANPLARFKSVGVDSTDRSLDIYERYSVGETLEKIGKDYGISRERIRQILKRQVIKDLGIKSRYADKHEQYINDTIRGLVEQNKYARLSGKLTIQLKKATEKGVKPDYFSSVHEFCEASNISAALLKEYEPEIYESLSRASKSRWNKLYPACLMCGTTTVKYRSAGYCENCYTKSQHFKQFQKSAYLRNVDKRREQNKAYRARYYARPEIKEKTDREYDLEYFGGNRKITLERDGYKCVGCGMPTTTLNKVGRPKVRVWHVNGNINDHSLNKLLSPNLRQLR
jgi:hypothetical protein